MIFPPFFKRLGDLRVPVESGLWIIHHLVFLHKILRFLLTIHLPADIPVSLFIHPAVPTQQHSRYTCLLPVSRGLLMMAAVPPCVDATNLCLASQGSAQGLFCFVFFSSNSNLEGGKAPREVSALRSLMYMTKPLGKNKC